jgi:hypothetical protein
MNLNGKMLLAVSMMVASLATAGCQTGSSADLVAPVETPDTAAVVQTANGVAKDFLGFRFYAPVAPPSARFEVRGVAPSANHFWSPGYYRWSGREHVWVGGSWILRRPGYTFVGPAWRPGFRRFEYAPGHWVRRF